MWHSLVAMQQNALLGPETDSSKSIGVIVLTSPVTTDQLTEAQTQESDPVRHKNASFVFTADLAMSVITSEVHSPAG